MTRTNPPNPYLWAPHILDVTQFVGTDSYELAVVVHRETEAQRASDAKAFKDKYPAPAPAPAPAPQPTGLLGFTGPIDSSTFRSWGQYAKGIDVLFNCSNALGISIGAVAKRVALELGPDNADELYWMGAWLLSLEQTTDLRSRLQQQSDEIERAKKKQRQDAIDAANVMHEKHARAKAFVLNEWTLRKESYKGNRTKFAKAFVEVIEDEFGLEIAHRTISATWLKGR